MESRIREYPFLLYASNYWGNHARECVDNMALVDDRCMKLRSAVMEYLGRTENRNAAAQIEYGKSYEHIDSTNYPKELSALHVAASFGLYSVIDLLLVDDADINARDSYGCTPLNRASRRGQQYVVSDDFYIILHNGKESLISPYFQRNYTTSSKKLTVS
jgi:hypothetical protein